MTGVLQHSFKKCLLRNGKQFFFFGAKKQTSFLSFLQQSPLRHVRFALRSCPITQTKHEKWIFYNKQSSERRGGFFFVQKNIVFNAFEKMFTTFIASMINSHSLTKHQLFFESFFWYTFCKLMKTSRSIVKRSESKSHKRSEALVKLYKKN